MAARVAVRLGPRSDRLRVPGGRREACREVRRAVRATLEARAVPDAELSVTLLDDSAISALNDEYLGHPGPTDVLAFPLFERGEPVLGDVCIGIEQAARQASALDLPFREEIMRLAVHGTLHILGMDHPTGPRRSASAMWRLQERIVARLRREGH
jgi:probable rRNA maturation factor